MSEKYAKWIIENNAVVRKLLDKQIGQVKKDIERCMSAEDLKNSRWVVYGKDTVRPL